MIKKKLKEFMTTKPALQRILEGVLQIEQKANHTQEVTGKLVKLCVRKSPR